MQYLQIMEGLERYGSQFYVSDEKLAEVTSDFLGPQSRSRWGKFHAEELKRRTAYFKGLEVNKARILKRNLRLRGLKATRNRAGLYPSAPGGAVADAATSAER